MIITDIRDNWAQQWIAPVVRSGVMETLPNYEFEPSRLVRRGELADTVSRLLSLIDVLQAGAGEEVASDARGDQRRAVHALELPGGVDGRGLGRDAARNGNFELLRSVTGAEAMEIIGRLEALSACTRLRLEFFASRVAASFCRASGARRGGAWYRCDVTDEVFTIANQLTLLRMLLIPAFVILTLYGEFGWSLLHVCRWPA